MEDRDAGESLSPAVLSRRRLLAAMAASLAAAMGGAHPAPAQQPPATTVSRGPTDKAVVALTFDCGSDRGHAELILDTLASKDVPCSFGMTGMWAESNPDLVRRMVDEGHMLINHSYTHPSFTGVSAGGRPLPTEDRLRELESTEELLVSLTGAGARPWFRPPYGDYDRSVLVLLGTAGFRWNVLWSVDVLGWRGISQDEVVSRIVNNHGNGYIYLMHVGTESQEGPGLRRIIDFLQWKGYGLATVAGLLGDSEPVPPAKFRVGAMVRVMDELALRATPSATGELVAAMDVGTVGTVLAGPTAADDVTWYQLETPYGTGWAAENWLEVASLVDQLVALLVELLKDILGEP